MTTADLFLQTCEEIKQKIQSNNEYDVIKAGGLIRLLIIDSPTLLSKANRPFGLKITFEVSNYNIPRFPGLVFWAIMDGIFPDNFPSPSPVNLSLDQFLSKEVILVNSETFTVRDVIDIIANQFGGVHYSETPSESRPSRQVLTELEKTTFVSNLGAVTATLRGIWQVIEKATEPVIKELESKQ